MDRLLIETYGRGGAVLLQALEGLTAADFRATPVAGTWTIGQIVLHLLDSDLIASERMKRVIAEDNPTLIGFNETRFAQNLYYNELDPFLAAEVLDKNRRITVEILRRLPESAFGRVGTHNEAGVITLEYLVKNYTGHVEHHLKFVREKRALLGKAL